MNALQMETGHKRDKQDIPLLARNGVKVLIAVGMGHPFMLQNGLSAKQQPGTRWAKGVL